MALVKTGGKDFNEIRPPAGMWLARTIDVVQLGLVASKQGFAPVERTRIIWALAPVPGNGLPTLDKDGNQFQHAQAPPAKMTAQTKFQPSDMYKLASMTFGGDDKIPMPFDDEYFMDRINQIVLVTNGEGGKYRKIAAMMPVPANLLSLVPAVPAGYVRVQNRPARPQQAQPAQPTVQTQVKVAQAYVAPAQQIADEDIPF